MKQYCQNFGHQATKDSNLGEMGDKNGFPSLLLGLFPGHGASECGGRGNIFFLLH